MIAAALAFAGIVSLKRFFTTVAVAGSLGFFAGGYAVWTLWDVANQRATVAALTRDLDAAKVAAETAQRQADELRAAMEWNTRVEADIEKEIDRAPDAPGCLPSGFLDGLRRLK